MVSHHLENNNDEDELLLSVDLHTIEAPNQFKQQQQQQMNRQPFSNASNNQQMRMGSSGVKNQPESQGLSTKLKRMPSDEISVECMTKIVIIVGVNLYFLGSQ